MKEKTEITNRMPEERLWGKPLGGNVVSDISRYKKTRRENISQSFPNNKMIVFSEPFDKLRNTQFTILKASVNYKYVYQKHN